MGSVPLTRDHAVGLDREDELAHFRDRFAISDPELIYLDGNSLGRLPRRAAERASELLTREWGEQLIRGWNEGWYEAPRRAGDAIGRLIGAAPGQVVVTDSTSVNLFKAIVAALRMRPERSKIVTDRLNFPTDLYIAQGALELAAPIPHAADQRILRIGPAETGIEPDLDALARAVDRETALVTLSHVTFKNGYLYEMEEITRIAHAQGALVVWDLSHSVGVIPTHLDRWGVDFAVGCTYKYLNGGPGAPAFIYVRRQLQEEAHSPIWGWFGQREPFRFDLDYTPAPGIARFLAGTPPILSLTTMEVALELTAEAGLDAIRRKSVAQTEYLIELFDGLLAPLGFELATPRESARRGSHISIAHPEGYRIAQALIDRMRLIPDFRAPDLIRLGCAPLYTSFEELWEGIDRIRTVVEQHLYDSYPAEPHGVT